VLKKSRRFGESVNQEGSQDMEPQFLKTKTNKQKKNQEESWVTNSIYK
jgi:hypothetical protein